MTRRHHPRPKILLELFSGTGSVRKEAERKGYKVISVDIDPKASPTICTDILKFNYDKPSNDRAPRPSRVSVFIVHLA